MNKPIKDVNGYPYKGALVQIEHLNDSIVVTLTGDFDSYLEKSMTKRQAAMKLLIDALRMLNEESPR